MEKHQTFPVGYIVIIISLLSMFLAIVAMIASVNYYQYPSHPFCSNDRAGAGFPLPFMCDWGLGGSPISSWGKIDLNDFPYGINPVGFAVEFLFYTFLSWLPPLFFISLYRLINRRIDHPPPDD